MITPETSVASRDPSIIVQTADLNKGSDALSIINLYINVRRGGESGFNLISHSVLVQQRSKKIFTIFVFLIITRITDKYNIIIYK